MKKLIISLSSLSPETTTEDLTKENVATYNKRSDNDNTTICVMLATMSPELLKYHKCMDAYTMIFHLKELYDEHSCVKRYKIFKKLQQCKMAKESSINVYILKMIGFIEKLARLRSMMDQKPSVNLVLQSLPKSYSQFIMNLNMNKFECALLELLNMLKTVEPNIKEIPNEVLRKHSTRLSAITRPSKQTRTITSLMSALPLWNEKSIEEEIKGLPLQLEGKKVI
ncbi:uncharacterized protein LOC111365730 [Olea europaea var. sylvestris]|uniref:uncharacterized protein LOC111365730 n=1 Tax=Olea europaea var. sylvestris TaxID=158386 RepID=UPI000C1D5E74|nr:uncharacterized protein LOC111365730 [Olea europaea var. sylvestris]